MIQRLMNQFDYSKIHVYYLSKHRKFPVRWRTLTNYVGTSCTYQNYDYNGSLITNNASTVTQGSALPNELNNYISTMQQQITEVKRSCLQVNKLTLTANNHLHGFCSSEIGSYHGVRFLNPEQAGCPRLPMLDPLRNLPCIILEIQTFGLGEIIFSYNVNISQFRLSTYFKRYDTNTTILVGTYLLYYGRNDTPEDIWWYWNGGSFPSPQYPPNVIKSYHETAGADKGCVNLITEVRNLPPDVSSFTGMMHNAQFGTSNKLGMIELANLRKTAKKNMRRHINHQLLVDCMTVEKLEWKKFEKAYRDLYGLSCLAYADTLQDPITELFQWFKNYPSSTGRIRVFLESSRNLNLIKNLTSMIEHMNELLYII